MDDEVGGQRQNGVQVFADPFAHMYGEELAGRVGGLGTGLGIPVRQVRQAGNGQSIGGRQDFTQFGGVRPAGGRPGEDDRSRIGLPQQPGPGRSSLAEIDNGSDTVGPGLGREPADVAGQHRGRGRPKIDVLKAVGRGHQFFEGHARADLYAGVGTVGVGIHQFRYNQTRRGRVLRAAAVPDRSENAVFGGGPARDETGAVVTQSAEIFHRRAFAGR